MRHCDVGLQQRHRVAHARGTLERTARCATIDWMVGTDVVIENPGSVSSSVRQPPPGVDAPSKTSTESPARASVSAAASPFGPDPTTTASSGDLGELTVPAPCAASPASLGFTAESRRQLRRVRRPCGSACGETARPARRWRDAPVRRRTPPRRDRSSLGGQLLAHELRVVDQHVGVLTERQRGLVILAQSVGSGSEGARAVVGHVHDVPVPSLTRNP